MKKLIVLLLLMPCLFIANNQRLYANEWIENQEKVLITGVIVDENGEPLTGASVLEKGTMNGAVSDLEGEFKLNIPIGASLVISYLGYESQEVLVTNEDVLLIFMHPDTQMLDAVVVTALGLKRNESSLTYALKEVKGEELTKVKDANLINSLTGKIAGLQINKASSGLGSSSKVLMRGIRSVVGNNQPLFVIDGMPILTASNEQAFSAVGGTADAGNRDGGDGISNLNSEDIESITVMKGAPAAALYGSQAANGVILITTKRGQSDRRQITFSTNFTFDNAFALPEMQDTYGSSDGITSWGERGTVDKAYDNLGDFYRTGVTALTTFAISAGNERYQTYFSYGNTTASGITEENEMTRHNINFRETASLFDGRLKLDGNVNLFHQQLDNRNTSGGFYMNPLVGLYRFPRGMDMTPYRENYEVYDEERNLYVQNWHSDIQDFEQNPYWVLNRIKSKDVRDRVMASISAEVQVTDWLKIQARGSVDDVSDRIRQQFYASTAPALAGENGRYVEMYFDETMYYADVIATANTKWKHFSLNAALGASINDKTVNSLRYD
ncbi:SusC/RagA family TonB-linked outer membrane protein, partial [Parabacteroides sp. OttesenSCG-928-G07]|nr:SusC/RagA family TonB-linked outer membrane protein [Parabacteroides sp. OttesenSCG-928-G07]